MSAQEFPFAPEPDAHTLTALVALLIDFRSIPATGSLTMREINGYARGFLLQYPEIASAYTHAGMVKKMRKALRRVQLESASDRSPTCLSSAANDEINTALEEP